MAPQDSCIHDITSRIPEGEASCHRIHTLGLRPLPARQPAGESTDSVHQLLRGAELGAAYGADQRWHRDLPAVGKRVMVVVGFRDSVADVIQLV